VAWKEKRKKRGEKKKKVVCSVSSPLMNAKDIRGHKKRLDRWKPRLWEDRRNANSLVTHSRRLGVDHESKYKISAQWGEAKEGRPNLLTGNLGRKGTRTAPLGTDTLPAKGKRKQAPSQGGAGD